MNKIARGQRTDGEITRHRILAAAGGLFASTGFAETTSKAIAASAEVDLASINYHFGSRSGLYQAVLVEAHRRLLDVETLQQLTQSDLKPEAKLDALLEYLVPDTADHGDDWHLDVLAREILAPSSHIGVLVQTEMLPKMVLVRQILSELTGIPVEAHAVTRCLLSFAAPCLMLVIGSRRLPGPIQQVAGMPRQAVIAHMRSYTLAGLAAISDEWRQGAVWCRL